MLPHIHGPAVKRPGTTFQGYAGHNTQAPRLLEFNFSATTRFTLEFSTSTIRVWSGQTGGLQNLLASINHPYSYSETWDVQARQINDVVYLTHPSHHPRVLTRKADNDWTLAEVDWKYPPLLDDYFAPESVTTPIVTTIHTQRLGYADEFEIPAAPVDELRWAEVTASGVADSAWLEVNWTATGGAPTTAGTLALELLDINGDWVSGGALTVSATATAAAKFQLAFQPAATDTSVLVRRRTWGGASWGAWSTLATVTNMLDAGYTAATMPTVQVRFAPGPDTRNAGTNLHTAEVTWLTSATGPLTTAFTGGEGKAFAANVFDMDPYVAVRSRALSITVPVVSGRKSALLQVLNNGAWVTLQKLLFYYPPGISGSGTFTYTGRLRQNGANLIWETAGSWGAGLFSNVTTFAGTGIGPWIMRVYTEELTTNQITVSTKDDVNPNSFSVLRYVNIERTPSAASDAGTGGVTVPAGKWIFSCVIPPDATIPAGATVRLQKRAGSTWSTVETWALSDSVRTIEYNRTADADQLASNTLYRALYTSTASLQIDASAIFETYVIPTASANRLAVSATAGNGRTMTATEDVFQSGHVGSFWQLAHRRDRASSELVGVVGRFPATRLTSKPVRIIGTWDFFSYGTWRGTVFLERRIGSDIWEVVRSWSSNKDRNIVATGTEDTDTDLRIRVSGMTGFAASGADVPRFVLEAADSRTYGLVKVTAVTNARTATVNVIRVLGSTESTPLWAEGAFSAVRGYPATLAVHEGRFWYGGTAFQPSALWASVSNDFNNFRRSTNDDGSFVVALAAETGSAIRWFSNADDALLIGTGGEEWAIRSNVEGQPLTPTNIRAGRRGAYSSAALQARVSQDATLFLQRNRRKLRQASYSSTDGAFQASDMTVLAPHITDAGIVQFAIQQAPWNVIWCVLADGKLASMTFEREQNVFAWSLHETNGIVKSIAILTGEQTDQIWLSVERAGRAMIERFDAAAMIGGSSGWQSQAFCDSALKLTGPAASFTIAHLPSRAVVGLADGVPFTATTNGSGVFTLAASATTVVVGQEFTATLQPMRVDLQMQDGTSQARRIRVSRVGVRVIDSRSGQVADGTDGTFETLEYSGSGLFSGMVEAAIESRSDVDMNVCVKDSKPLPFTVAALVLKGDVFGD
jgi:hypothetical protein